MWKKIRLTLLLNKKISSLGMLLIFLNSTQSLSQNLPLGLPPLPLPRITEYADQDLYELKIDVTALNPLILRSAIEFLPNTAARIDARMELQVFNNPDAISVPHDKKITAQFLQNHRQNPDSTISRTGRTAVLTLSALPIIAVDQFPAKEITEYVALLAKELTANGIAQFIDDTTAVYIPHETINSAVSNTIFQIGTPIVEVLQGLVGDLSKDLLEDIIKENYNNALLRNTLKKAYYGAFKVYHQKNNQEAFIIYYKIGYNENIDTSPLADRMAVQAAHYLAGSGSAPSATVGIMHTVGQGRTLGYELDIYNYRQPFAQPVFEMANQIATFSDTVLGDVSGELTLSYFDDPRNLDILLSGKIHEGEPAGSVHIRKGFGEKINFYLDAAYSERNRKWKFPSIIEGTALQKILPFIPQGNLRKILEGINAVPDRAIQEPSSTSYFSFLIAVDRLLYSGDAGEFHYNVYASKDHGYYDVLRNGINKVEEKSTLGSAISWTRSVFGSQLKAYTSIEYSETQGSLPTGFFVPPGTQKPDKKSELAIAVVGSLELMDKRRKEAYLLDKQKSRSLRLEEGFRKNIEHIYEIILKLDKTDDERFLIELNKECTLQILESLYLNLNSIEINELGRPFRSLGEIYQKPDIVYQFLKMYLPCS